MRFAPCIAFSPSFTITGSSKLLVVIYIGKSPSGLFIDQLPLAFKLNGAYFIGRASCLKTMKLFAYLTLTDDCL